MATIELSPEAQKTVQSWVEVRIYEFTDFEHIFLKQFDAQGYCPDIAEIDTREKALAVVELYKTLAAKFQQEKKDKLAALSPVELLEGFQDFVWTETEEYIREDYQLQTAPASVFDRHDYEREILRRMGA